MYLDKVSVGLFSTATLFIMEEVSASGILGLSRPLPLPTSTSIAASVIISGNAFGVYQLDQSVPGEPTLTNTDRLSCSFDLRGYRESISGPREIASLDSTPMRVDMFARSMDEGEYTGTLEIFDGETLMARLSLYCEIEGADERMDTLLAFLEKRPMDSDNFIFRDTDVNEDMVDHVVMNRRKKLYLSQHKNLLPYITSIKSVLGFINYFGYNDIRLKEYWENVTDNKLWLRDVVLNESDRLTDPSNVPAYPFVRIPDIGLFYDLVRPKFDGELDEDGLPVTEKAFAYSPQEVLIKLFGLKEFLERENVTGTSRIRDVAGEYHLFDKVDINSWKDQSKLLEFDLQIEPQFEVSTDFGHIEDLRLRVNDYICALPVDWRLVTNGTDKVVDNPSCWVGYFDPYHREVPQLLDEPLIPVGKVIKLTNKSFSTPWCDFTGSWVDTASNNLTVTWENSAYLNYYEVEWQVKGSAGQEDQVSTFYYSKRGSVTAMESLEVVLPYYGHYDVTLILYGFDGQVDRKTFRRAVEIKALEVEFSAFYRIRQQELQAFSDNYLRWDQIWNQWKQEVQDTERYRIGDSEVKYRSLNPVKYIDLFLSQQAGVGIAPRTWVDFPNNTWNDNRYVSWSHTEIEQERAAWFFIDKIFPAGKLHVGRSIITLPSPLNINEWERAAKFLNASEDPEVSLYHYVARPYDKPTYIDAVAKYPGDIADRWIGSSEGLSLHKSSEMKWIDFRWDKRPWDSIDVSWSGSSGSLEATSIESPFTADNVKVFSRNFQVPVMVPVFFVVDNCKISGKTRAFWSVLDAFGNTVVDSVESLTFVYTFQSTGYYSIKLTIRDTNGNEVTKLKEKHVRVSAPIDFAKDFFEPEQDLIQL